jgi:hypothetical protein
MLAAMHQSLQTMRILWGAMNATPLVFAVVLIVARPDDLVPEVPQMPFILGPVALVVLAVSWLIPRHQLDLAIRNLKLEQRTEVSKEETLFRHAAPTHQVFARPFSDAYRKLAMAVQTSFILGMALSEAVVLFGLVIGLMGFDRLWAAPFFAAGWLAMLLRFPRTAPLRRRIEALHGASFADDGSSPEGGS